MLDNEVKELVEYHLEEPHETLKAYEYFDHIDWKEYKDNKLQNIVSFFLLPDRFMFDMVITMDRDNKFSLTQWKIISNILKNRTKEIRINSDPSNIVLHKGAKKYGGYFVGNDIIFPIPIKEST